MATRSEILCMNKSDRPNPHERILSVGGLRANGTRWKISQPRAIELVERGEFSFYVTRCGYTVEVVVAMSPYGHKYVKTTADGEQPNNLLSLPECPQRAPRLAWLQNCQPIC